MTLRLVIFDVDGTLVDSIAHIETIMDQAFDTCDLERPDPGAVRSLIGVSLPQLLVQLRPDLNTAMINELAHSYMQLFSESATTAPVDVTAPLFLGTREMLQDLASEDELLLAVATGKSRRGLNRMFQQHDLAHFFVSTQVADDHPSKPNPSMVEATLVETGVEHANAILVGDTTFDMDMARAAGIASVGVKWGNHTPTRLIHSADHMISDWDALRGVMKRAWDQS